MFLTNIVKLALAKVAAFTLLMVHFLVLPADAQRFIIIVTGTGMTVTGEQAFDLSPSGFGHVAPETDCRWEPVGTAGSLRQPSPVQVTASITPSPLGTSGGFNIILGVATCGGTPVAGCLASDVEGGPIPSMCTNVGVQLDGGTAGCQGIYIPGRAPDKGWEVSCIFF